jgi:uncharacterized membrane protein YphA (DoxX/SURF4 family)
VWEWTLRVVIGTAFIFAGWLKVQDPAGFADGVGSFAILLKWSIAAFVLALPIFEILAGTLLIIGRPRRIGALALALLTSTFCIAPIWAIARGLKVNCGCFFGVGSPHRFGPRSRDPLRLLFSVWCRSVLPVYFRPRLNAHC